MQVVQHLLGLGLCIHSATISSDRSWFYDVFEITEADGTKAENPRKLQSLTQVWRPFQLAAAFFAMVASRKSINVYLLLACT